MHHTTLPAMHLRDRQSPRQIQAESSMAYLVSSSSMGITQDRVACQAQVCESFKPVEAVHITPTAQLVVAQQDCVQMWKSLSTCSMGHKLDLFRGLAQPDNQAGVPMTQGISSGHPAATCTTQNNI